MKKITIYLIMILFLGISCSEEVKVNPELAGPLYGLTKGEPGSVDELIYNTWEEWGMYYLYKFEPYAFQVTNWSGYFNKWYTPVKEENTEVIWCRGVGSCVRFCVIRFVMIMIIIRTRWWIFT